MSYTPEQIAEACAAADSFAASPAKNTLSVRKLRVLAEIVREQGAIIEQQRAIIDDLSGKLDYAFIAADKAEQELLAQRERITTLEASLKSIGDQAEECGDPANPAFFGLVSLIVDEIHKHKENPT